MLVALFSMVGGGGVPWSLGGYPYDRCSVHDLDTSYILSQNFGDLFLVTSDTRHSARLHSTHLLATVFLSLLDPLTHHMKKLTIQRIHTLLPINFPFFLQHQLLHNKRRRGWASKPFFSVVTCSLGVGNIFELEDNLLN